MTVAELDQRISSEELTEWMAYERVTGPLGRRRGDHQAAIIAATVANANRDKRGKKAKVTDFLIDYAKSARRRQEPSDMLRALRSITKRLGGTVNER